MRKNRDDPSISVPLRPLNNTALTEKCPHPEIRRGPDTRNAHLHAAATVTAMRYTNCTSSWDGGCRRACPGLARI